MSNCQPFSVLMSVYAKDCSEWVLQALQSVLSNSVKPAEIVVVIDGPIPEPLHHTLTEFAHKYPQIKLCPLAQNGGLGAALAYGLQQCSYELVARMDADDISLPDRFEKQLKVFETYPQVAIVSGIVEEFTSDRENIQARRVVPETQEQILLFAKTRNPFNHPCVMYKKSAVQDAGGYQPFFLLEDYYLWIRMLQKGYHGYNIQQCLLLMRAGMGMYKRRGSWKYVRAQRDLFKYMKDTGFITYREYMISSCARGISSLLPTCIRKQLFKILLRK